MNETDLVLRAQAGDREAFRQLVERYSAVTERTARALLADRADAEDSVQEAWLDAWRGLSRFDSGRAFRPWILTLVANRCRMKARKHRPASVPYDDTIGEMVGGFEEMDLVPGGSLWDEDLNRALLTLDGDQQRALSLRYYADLQLDEIAALTGVPVGTVKSRLHRALQHLRERLPGSVVARVVEE